MLNNVPLSSQSLGQTQAPINANFSTIDTSNSVNHVPYNDASGNQGMHFFITLPISSFTLPTVSSTQIGMYPLNWSPSGLTEIFIRRSSGTDYPMTGKYFTGSFPTTGYTYLPSGIIQQWTSQAGVTAAQTISLPLSFPNACLWASASIYNTISGDQNAFASVIAATTSNVRVQVNTRTSIGDGTGNVLIFAIGY